MRKYTTIQKKVLYNRIMEEVAPKVKRLVTESLNEGFLEDEDFEDLFAEDETAYKELAEKVCNLLKKTINFREYKTVLVKSDASNKEILSEDNIELVYDAIVKENESVLLVYNLGKLRFKKPEDMLIYGPKFKEKEKENKFISDVNSVCRVSDVGDKKYLQLLIKHDIDINYDIVARYILKVVEATRM